MAETQTTIEGHKEIEEVEGDPITEFGIHGQRGGFRGGCGIIRARGGCMPEYVLKGTLMKYIAIQEALN